MSLVGKGDINANLLIRGLFHTRLAHLFAFLRVHSYEHTVSEIAHLQHLTTYLRSNTLSQKI